MNKKRPFVPLLIVMLVALLMALLPSQSQTLTATPTLPRYFVTRTAQAIILSPQALPTLTPSPRPFNPNRAAACNGVLTPRLQLGRNAEVTPGNVVNLRTAPDTSAQRIAQIPDAATVAILEGPVCADGYAWWRVAYSGTAGWAAEGADGRYWLALLPPDAPETRELAEARDLLTVLMGDEDSTRATTIASIDPIANVQTTLHRGEARVSQAAWNPTGDTLAYILNLSALTLWQDGAETRLATLQTLDPCFRLWWSPDGAQIYCDTPNSDGYRGSLIDAETGAVTPLINALESGGVRGNPWSPDGTQLLVNLRNEDLDADTGLFLYDVGNGLRTPLIRARDVTDASWSPDGSIYLQIGESILRFEGRDGTLTTLLDQSRVRQLQPAPDGVRVAYIEDVKLNDFQLFVADRDLNNPQQLTFEPQGNISTFAWSPDGRWLAYVTQEINNPQIRSRTYIVAPDGSSAPQLIFTSAFPPMRPLWQP